MGTEKHCVPLHSTVQRTLCHPLCFYRAFRYCALFVKSGLGCKMDFIVVITDYMKIKTTVQCALSFSISCFFLFPSLSLSSRLVLLLSEQRHDGLPLSLPPLPRLPALPELLLAWQHQRLAQQQASDEGALFLGESRSGYSSITAGGSRCAEAHLDSFVVQRGHFFFFTSFHYCT